MIVDLTENLRLLGKPEGWLFQKKKPLLPAENEDSGQWVNVTIKSEDVVFASLPDSQHALMDYFVRITKGESVEDFHLAMQKALSVVNEAFSKRMNPNAGSVIQTPLN